MPLNAQSGSVVFGRVVTADSAAMPVEGALVTVVAPDLSTHSSALGAFRVRSPRSGPTAIRIMRLGYRPIEVQVVLPAGDSLELEIAMEPLAELLPTVNVAARARDWRLSAFDDRRRRGIGTFFDEHDIARHAVDGRLTSLLRQVPGATISTSRANSAQYLLAARGARPWSGGGPCYAAIVQDGIWIYRGGPGATPFNLNGVNAKSLVAIEYYRSTAQVPAELAGLGSECGVLVLWTR